MTPTQITLTFDEQGTWYDFFADAEVSCPPARRRSASSPASSASGPTWTCRRPRWTSWASPWQKRHGGDVPAAFGITAAFPNPLATAPHFGTASPHAADVQVEVVDVLGRRVLRPRAKAPRSAGLHTARVDASRLSRPGSTSSA